MKIAKFLRTPVLKNICERLLLIDFKFILYPALKTLAGVILVVNSVLTLIRIMSYDNIQSHKKARLYLLSRKHSFEKTTGRRLNLPDSLFGVNKKYLF